MSLIPATGAGWIRDDIPWSSFDHGPNGYSLNNTEVGFLNAAQAQGLKVVAIIQSGGVYGAPSNYPATPTVAYYSGPDYGAYNAQAYAAAAAWLANAHPAIGAIEVLNEPNNTMANSSDSWYDPNWPADYVALVSATTNAVHSANPNVKVIGLGFQGSAIVNLASMNPVMDGVVYHPYDPNTEKAEECYEPPYAQNGTTYAGHPGDGYEAWLSVIQPIAQAHHWTIWETESSGDGGWETWADNMWWMRRIFMTLWHGIDHVFKYDFMDQSSQGVTYTYAAPNPVYWAIERLFAQGYMAFGGHSQPIMEGMTGAGKPTVTSSDPNFLPNSVYGYNFNYGGNSAYTVTAVWEGDYAPQVYGATASGIPAQASISIPHATYIDPYNSFYMNAVTGRVYSFNYFPHSSGGGNFVVTLPISQEPMVIVLNYN